MVLLAVRCTLPARQAGGTQRRGTQDAVEDQLACGSHGQVDECDRRGQEECRQCLPRIDQGDDQDGQGQPQRGRGDPSERECFARCDAGEKEPEEVAVGP